jgi:PPOX class probable F420-dependent enzyme
MKDGGPQATQVWYMYENGLFYVNTTTDRVKYRNVRRDARVVLLVHEGYSYVQVRGDARIAKGRDPQADIRRLAIRYRGEAEGERQFRERYSKQQRVTMEVLPSSIEEYF